MIKKTTSILIILLVIMGVLIGCVADSSVATEKESTTGFKNISAQELKTMLENKDFFLLDVHIPEQEHIEGTDEFISYLDIEAHLSMLPEDKDTPIVVYCRSGNMSETASQELIDLGYTNVTNLEGGVKAFNAIE